MKKVFVVLVVCMFFVSEAYAGEMGQSERTQLKEEIKKEVMEEIGKSKTELPAWTQRMKLSGLFEGEYRWMELRDVSDKDSDSTSDLYLRRLELGLEAGLTDWIKANAVLNSEFIGDDVNQGDEKMTVDEATMTFQKEDVPLYLIIGKRAQPFGIFENHLITDPMTQDAFETKRAGVTVGATGPIGLDVSATVYKGEEQMEHLVGSGLFEVTRAGEATDDVGSYILSVSILPMEDHLQFFVSYLSEPGRGKRNDTVSAAFSIAAPGLKALRFDGEYMKALKREIYEGSDEAFREGVFSLTASFEFNVRERHEIGGALFEEKRAHVIEEPIEAALRYERFDDDDLADKTASWSAKDRYSASVRYAFFHDAERELTAYAAVEYRYTNYRLDRSLKDVRAGNNQEMYARLGVSF
ncbi:MAG: LbtU family siderophore porin [Nitrospirae bacterium]|nr:LbtU family siderophore porin [Nitrospirota bacterium]